MLSMQEMLALPYLNALPRESMGLQCQSARTPRQALQKTYKCTDLYKLARFNISCMLRAHGLCFTCAITFALVTDR
jgi:hypothetical protein